MDCFEPVEPLHYAGQVWMQPPWDSGRRKSQIHTLPWANNGTLWISGSHTWISQAVEVIHEQGGIPFLYQCESHVHFYTWSWCRPEVWVCECEGFKYLYCIKKISQDCMNTFQNCNVTFHYFFFQQQLMMFLGKDCSSTKLSRDQSST